MAPNFNESELKRMKQFLGDDSALNTADGGDGLLSFLVRQMTLCVTNMMVDHKVEQVEQHIEVYRSMHTYFTTAIDKTERVIQTLTEANTERKKLKGSQKTENLSWYLTKVNNARKEHERLRKVGKLCQSLIDICLKAQSAFQLVGKLQDDHTATLTEDKLGKQAEGSAEMKAACEANAKTDKQMKAVREEFAVALNAGERKEFERIVKKSIADEKKKAMGIAAMAAESAGL